MIISKEDLIRVTVIHVKSQIGFELSFFFSNKNARTKLYIFMKIVKLEGTNCSKEVYSWSLFSSNSLFDVVPF
jgi:hypothetical protein